MSKVTRLFDDICSIHPKRIAFIFYHDGHLQTRTFEDLQNDVAIATETLTRYGVRSGDRILAFANSCRNGHRHTHDEFKHVMTLNSKYKKLLKETGDENGVFDVEYDYIKKLYAERLEKNDFL